MATEGAAGRRAGVPDAAPAGMAMASAAQGNSRVVTSSQTGVHQRLALLVARHAAQPWRRPVALCNQQAFDVALAAWQRAGRAPLILDAGCGVGRSTLHLAQQFPDHFVLGVDQSAERLARQVQWPGPLPLNCLCVRANLVDFWRLLLTARIFPARHYLLYPNPWPKIGQLQRRWHGHPVFPTLVALGGALECRSNWRLYIDEFGAALAQLTGRPVATEAYAPVQPITPFEAKYQASGQALWRCRLNLAPAVVA